PCSACDSAGDPVTPRPRGCASGALVEGRCASRKPVAAAPSATATNSPLVAVLRMSNLLHDRETGQKSCRRLLPLESQPVLAGPAMRGDPLLSVGVPGIRVAGARRHCLPPEIERSAVLPEVPQCLREVEALLSAWPLIVLTDRECALERGAGFARP